MHENKLTVNIDKQYEDRKAHAGIDVPGKVDYTTPEGAELQKN